MIKVSIIVPVYNVEQYLNHCLESMVNQTLNDIEIILIDDASTDNSRLIMRDYERKYPEKINCIYSSINKKQGAARNKGIHAAKGEYILFVDSDDYIATNVCEEMYNSAIENNADIVYCDFYSHYLQEDKLEYDTLVSENMTGIMTKDKQRAMFFVRHAPWGKLIRKTIITDNGLYFPENIFWEDRATVPFYNLYAGKTAHIAEALYFYVIREDSTCSMHNSTHHFDAAKAALILFDRFHRSLFYQEYAEEINMLFLVYFYSKTLDYVLERFDEIPLHYLEYLRDTMHEKYPGYRNNYYYKRMPEMITYTYLEINDESPVKLKEMIEKDGFADRKEYIPYYETYKEEIYRLIDDCGGFEEIGIFGAGKKAVDFLKVCAIDGHRPKAVYDNNSALWGKRLQTGNLVYNFSEYTEYTQTILVISKNLYSQIEKQIRAANPNIRVIGLDLFLQFGLQ